MFKVSFIFIISFLSVLTCYPIEHGCDICGGQDDRVPYFDLRIGRTLKYIDSPSGCTATLIGPNCMISAGHCVRTFSFVEFNIPLSVEGKIRHPGSEDIYTIDRSSIVFENGGVSRDWAVFKLNLDSRGPVGNRFGFFEIELSRKVVTGELLRMSGYGFSNDLALNFTLQTSTGELVGRWLTSFLHQIDGEGGNSGSAVVIEDSNKIMGVHTHGGCVLGSGKGNHGTVIFNNKKFQEAIRGCLK